MRTMGLLLLILLASNCQSSGVLLKEAALKRGNYQEVKGFFPEDADLPRPDQMPMYPGGLKGLMNDVASQISYPQEAVKKRQEGTVVVKYIIEKDGSVTQLAIEKSVAKSLDQEALRVVKRLKRWYPGLKAGLPVRVEFRQPFNFRIPASGR